MLNQMITSYASYCVSFGLDCTAAELAASWTVTTNADIPTTPTGGYPDFRVVVATVTDDDGSVVILTGYACVPEIETLFSLTAMVDAQLCIVPHVA
jgi:hypothetical protein